MGTPEFSVPALDALVQSQYEILCVYTQPPRPAGRGKKYKISAVHKYANNLGILVKNPSKLNTKEIIDEILEFKPDVIFVDRTKHFALEASKTDIPLIIHLRRDHWAEIIMAKETLYKSGGRKIAINKWEKMGEECFKNSKLILI